MNRVVEVSNFEAWQGAITELGTNNLAVVSFPVLEGERLEIAQMNIAGLLRSTKGGLYARPETIPDEVCQAGHAVAAFSGRIPLHSEGKVTSAVHVFGNKHSVTGLHTDISQSLPTLTSLFVLEGEVDAYFKLLPLDILEGDTSQKLLELMDDLTVPNSNAGVGHSLREDAKPDFVKITAKAGTILAFPAAGSLERSIQPSMHELSSATELRRTLPLLDKHFAKYSVDNPAA
jgi:hypothetical protein